MKRLKKILGGSVYILIILAVTLVVVKFVAQRIAVDGMSMEPTLYNGDNLIINKISYDSNEPERFDVVVFPFSGDEGTFYIKRIIGLPGENIRIDDEGKIYINGEELKENFGKETIEDPGMARYGIDLGLKEFFVLGDNRNDSSDSRFASVGNISRNSIIGKAWIRIWPLNRIGFIR
ncbi:MAG TPA: signal peptidase I [Lachnospiraceae bacterium]|nr:signal peptidase I [Lachnospiraceae bacterium]